MRQGKEECGRDEGKSEQDPPGPGQNELREAQSLMQKVRGTEQSVIIMNNILIKYVLKH